MIKKLSLICLIALMGCTTGTTAIRGSLVRDNEIAKLRTGVQTKQDVLQILGTPSSTATLDPNKWFYITDHTQTKPLKKTEVVKRQILTLSFKDDILDSVKKVDETKSKHFRPNEEKTKTRGAKLGIIEQMLLNLTSGISH